MMKRRPCTIALFLLSFALMAPCARAAGEVEVDPETGRVKSLVSGRPVGEIAIAGRLHVELHAHFMAARGDEGHVLNWYNLGYSGGSGKGREQGGTFGNFGLDVPWQERARHYPVWSPVDDIPAVRFDGQQFIKADFPAEAELCGDRPVTVELWVRHEAPAAGEIILGWQTENGAASSAPVPWPDGVEGSPQWRHIAVVAEGEVERWYVDGALVREGLRHLVIGEGHRLVLGGASEQARSFRGHLAAVRLHRGALDAEAIARNAAGGVMLGTTLVANIDPNARPEQGYYYDTWSDADPDDYFTPTSAHFRYRIPYSRLDAMNERQRQEHDGRIENMLKLSEACYHAYAEIHALRMPIVSSRARYRGDGIKYLIHIAPTDGASWMGWQGDLGFGYPMQGPGHMNPHELVHGVQGQTGGGLQGNYWEVHANFPQTWVGVWQINPAFLETRDQALFEATGRSYYHGQLMMRHLAQTPQYGPMFISKLWYSGEDDAYPWITFNRFNPDPDTTLGYEWARMVQRNVTWDYVIHPAVMPGERVSEDVLRDDIRRNEEMAVRYGRVLLHEIPYMPGWYRPAKNYAPQQTGWNLVPLTWEDDRVTVDLQGYANPERGSDWHYGLVAADAEGHPRYSDIRSTSGPLSMERMEGDRELYLAVAAIPTKVMAINMVGDVRTPAMEQFPYRVRLEGAAPRNMVREFYDAKFSGVEGAPHPNGGGFVARTATVADTAYVGPDARVMGNATVSGHARIEDHAVVENATVQDHAIVSGHALVNQNATVKDHARVRDFGRVSRSTLAGHAKVVEHATLESGQTTDGRVTLKGMAIQYGGQATGSAIMDGNFAKGNERITGGRWMSWSWGAGKNPGESEEDFGGLYLRYTFENPHPTLARDDHGLTWGYLHGDPELRVIESRRIHAAPADARETLDSMDPPADDGDHYGQEIATWFHPPQTGEYTFWLSCSDAGELWLSTEPGNPHAAQRIAFVESPTPPDTFDAQPGQRSDPVRLEVTMPYFIYAVHKAAEGDDHVQVAFSFAQGPRQPLTGPSISLHPVGPRGGALRQVWRDVPGSEVSVLYAEPEQGRALVLDGQGQFVELQPDVSDHAELIVVTRLKWGGGAPGQRVFDFSNGTGNGLYLTPKGEDGNMALVMDANGEQHRITLRGALPENIGFELAVIITDEGARLLVNGRLAGHSEAITMRPFLENAGGTFLNLLGACRQFESFFNGQIEQFEIYREVPEEPVPVDQ